MLYLSNLYYSKSNFDETIIKNQHEQEHIDANDNWTQSELQLDLALDLDINCEHL